MRSIKTALCSFGMSGKLFHAPFIEANPRFELYGVYERSKNVAAEIYPGIKTFRTLDEMLADAAIELVVVNTPNATHFEYAKTALLAGKHVIVEKPFTIEEAEAQELIALAKRLQLNIFVFHNRRWDSDFMTVKKVINEKLLGEIVEAEIHYDRFKEELSYKLHKETPGPGSGALYDLGSHLIDQSVALFGMPVAVFGDIQVMRPISKVDDYFEVLLFYPQLRVRLKGTYVARETVPSFVIHGLKGSFIKSRADVQEAKLMEGYSPLADDWGIEPAAEAGILHTETNGEVVRKNIVSEVGNYMGYYNSVYKTLRENKPAVVSAEDGLNVIRIIKAAFKSNNEKRIVSL